MPAQRKYPGELRERGEDGALGSRSVSGTGRAGAGCPDAGQLGVHREALRSSGAAGGNRRRDAAGHHPDSCRVTARPAQRAEGSGAAGGARSYPLAAGRPVGPGPVLFATAVRATAAAPAPRAAVTPSGRAACPPVRPAHQRCLVGVRTRPGTSRLPAARAAAAPSGWGANAIEAAHQLPVARGSGQTVAVVDAFRTPHLAGYLAAYRKQYGLPPYSTSGGCLRMVNEAGHTTPLPRPAGDTGCLNVVPDAGHFLHLEMHRRGQSAHPYLDRRLGRMTGRPIRRPGLGGTIQQNDSQSTVRCHRWDRRG
jgi:hypothetical protein